MIFQQQIQICDLLSSLSGFTLVRFLSPLLNIFFESLVMNLKEREDHVCTARDYQMVATRRNHGSVTSFLGGISKDV